MSIWKTYSAEKDLPRATPYQYNGVRLCQTDKNGVRQFIKTLPQRWTYDTPFLVRWEYRGIGDGCFKLSLLETRYISYREYMVMKNIVYRMLSYFSQKKVVLYGDEVIYNKALGLIQTALDEKSIYNRGWNSWRYGSTALPLSRLLRVCIRQLSKSP